MGDEAGRKGCSIGAALIVGSIASLIGIIIFANIPSVRSDDFWGVGVMLLIILIPLPLFIAGIIVYKLSSKEERRKV